MLVAFILNKDTVFSSAITLNMSITFCGGVYGGDGDIGGVIVLVILEVFNFFLNV